jgi:AraC-like DNA-binding protein
MDLAVEHFSTDQFPERDRVAAYREIFGRSVVKLDLTPIEGRPLREVSTFYRLDNLGIAQLESNGQIGVRTNELLADSNDDLIFLTPCNGFGLASQLGREIALRAGSATMLSAGEYARVDFPDRIGVLSWRIPRRALGALVANPEDMLIREVPADNEALRLLVDFTTMTLERHELRTPELQRLFVTTVHDLLALAIGAKGETAELAQGRGLRAARLAAIKADIRARYRDHGLTLTAVALRAAVTARYVQALFESEGLTFSQFLLDTRLERVNDMLRDRAHAQQPISVIAYECGFGDLSHFNRAFRRRYGATPSNVRGEGE